MIKANELRIGNLVSYNGEVFKMRSISKDRLHLANITDVDGYAVDVRLEEIEPIPLTEEILLKMGFTDVSGNMKTVSWFEKKSEIVDFTITYHKEKGDFSLEISQDKEHGNSELMFIALKVKHVHQLQNLFHILTGTEININL